MENTSRAASVSFVALSRIAGGRAAMGSAVHGTGLSLTSSWIDAALPSAGSQAMRRTASEHNYIDVPATNVAALAKQGAPPRGEPR